MNEKLSSEFIKLVDITSNEIIKQINESYSCGEAHVNTFILNVCTAGILKTISPYLKEEEFEQFCESIKNNLMENFKAFEKDKKNEN